MKKIFALLCLTIVFSQGQSQNILHYRISKPLCILNFAKTMSGEEGTSSTLRQYISEHIPKTDTLFYELIKQYKTIQLDYSFINYELPEKRKRFRSSLSLISKIAISSDSLQQFKLATVGILPHTEHHKLFSILEQLAPYYDSLLWKKYYTQLQSQVKELEKYNSKVFNIFKKLNVFYSTHWNFDIPFYAAVYPIPGSKGNTTATPFSNGLSVGVLTDEKNYPSRMGVVLHEICHVLYEEQAAKIQHEIDGYFTANTSPYSPLAYSFFNEALATALGNGWAYSQLSGKHDTTSWYNNQYINGFAHAIYPLIEEYLNNNKAIDKNFIDSSVALFAKEFPKSVLDYGVLLNRIHLYYDAESENERRQISNILVQYFQINSSQASSPISHKYSIDFLKNSEGTQLIIIDRNYNENIKLLSQQFPSLNKYAKYKNNDNFIVSFFDAANRPIILIKTTSLESLGKCIKTLSETKYINTEQPFISVD